MMIRRLIHRRHTFGLLCLISGLYACKQVKPMDIYPQTESYLSQVVENRHTPLDSVTVRATYNRQGQLIQETYSDNYYRNRRAFRLHCFYNIPEGSILKDYRDEYRFYTTNEGQQIVASKKYFGENPSRIKVFESDAYYYDQTRLMRQEHVDHSFLLDYQTMAFPYGLWLTKRYFEYASSSRLNQVVNETDSVFLTHDIPVGSVAIIQAPPRYLFTNTTRYEYNQQGEQVRKITQSGASSIPVPLYSGGRSVFSPFGSFSTSYPTSWSGRFLAGRTTYRYEYDSGGKLIKRCVDFVDQQTEELYSSVFTYEYEWP